jgi:hypothetical protein
MDAIQPAKRHSPLMTEGRQAPADFLDRMQREGISVSPLEVTEVEPGLHEKAEGIIIRPIYRISWRKQPLRLLGVLSLPRTDGGSGRFIKISPQRINMPPEASRRYGASRSVAEVDESAAFLSTALADSHLHVMLAVRVADRWLELYRWHASWAELGISRLDIRSL